jgi:hypothetical protein
MGKRSRNQCGESDVTDRFDIFKQPVPHFSHNGKQHISSLPGAVMTLLIGILILVLFLDRILAHGDALHKTEYKVV